MEISSKSKIIIHTHLNIKMNPTNCIFVLFKGWPGKNMNGYQHCHYYQLILIIIKIKCFITIFSPGWLRWAGSSVSLSTSCRSARGSCHLSFQISIRTSSFFFDRWYKFLSIASDFDLPTECGVRWSKVLDRSLLECDVGSSNCKKERKLGWAFLWYRFKNLQTK